MTDKEISDGLVTIVESDVLNARQEQIVLAAVRVLDRKAERKSKLLEQLRALTEAAHAT